MRTISLRAFRVQVPKLTEPVTVVMRKGQDIVQLGWWTPGNGAPIVERRPGERPPQLPEELPFSTRPFTPVPKSGGKR